MKAIPTFAEQIQARIEALEARVATLEAEVKRLRKDPRVGMASQQPWEE